MSRDSSKAQRWPGMPIVTVRVPCTGCGEAALPLCGLTVVRHGRREWYQFDCARCGADNTADGSSVTANRLIEAGVRVLSVAAASESRGLPDAPALTLDDLLELHIALSKT
ncbi:MAG: hypothetical protein ACXVJW_10385 [Acidimicrobiia bacterium]